MKIFQTLLILLVVFWTSAVRAETVLTVSIGGVTHKYTAEELLKNPAVMTIAIPRDASYGRTMIYDALPLSEVIRGFALPADQVLHAVASDGFTATLQNVFVRRAAGDKGAVPYLAIEPPGRPWPNLDGKDNSAGPFYIVWMHPEADDIRPEQWPYGVKRIAASAASLKRWPQLAIEWKVPRGSDVRKGYALFATNCMVCHKMNGAGDAEVGPDLNLPRNPVEYFQKEALHTYIRDPASLRSWNTMGMKGFDKEALSDQEIDQVIAYLDYMSKHKKKR
jgi:mono/diheme cytochrome c family protein